MIKQAEDAYIRGFLKAANTIGASMTPPAGANNFPQQAQPQPAQPPAAQPQPAGGQQPQDQLHALMAQLQQQNQQPNPATMTGPVPTLHQQKFQPPVQPQMPMPPRRA